MNALTRLKVARNADYHQQMADYYASLAPPVAREAAAEGTTPRRAVVETTATTEEGYLAALHADIAQQLRDVVGEGSPPAIIGIDPPISRETGPIVEPRTRRQVH